MIWNVLSLSFVRWNGVTAAVVDASLYEILKNRHSFDFKKYERICSFALRAQWKLFPSVTLVNNK
jgi:hypothetical protein